MSGRVQFVKTEDGSELAVLPRADFERLKDAAEMLADVAAYDRAVKANAGREWISDEMMGRLIDENPVRVWREHRGFTQGELARRAGIRQGYLSMIEHATREPTTHVLRGLARVLEVDMDDLLSNPDDGTESGGGTIRSKASRGRRKPLKADKHPKRR